MKKKILSLLLAVAMMFSLAVTASAEETKGSMDGQIVILHSNDVHGAIGGYAKAAALKKAFEDVGAYVLLMDAGDFSQGDPTVSVSQGATAVELMNMAGYDVAAPGNHEFDYGYENLTELAKKAEFPIVAANILYNGKVAFNDNVTFTAPDGTKIGVFGLDTPETATKAHPAKIKGVTFLAGQTMFDCAQAQVDSLKADGCDIIVCLGHLGIDDESVGNRSIDLLEKVKGIDIFIDGHSHSTMEEAAAVSGGKLYTMPAQGMVTKETNILTPAEGKALLTSTGTKFATVGAIIISEDGSIAERSFPMDDALTITPNAAVAARAAAIQKEIDDEYGTVFAKTEVDLNGAKDPGNRTEETNLGNLITDALVWGAAKNANKVDAAITNGGGIRASIKKGNITKKDINTVLPFGNTLVTMEVTGAKLLEALEASTFCTPTAIGGFPQVSGIVYTIDTTKAYDQGDLYGSTTYHRPNSINRVTIQSVGGKAFDPKATYTIATNDFVSTGGDTYYAVKDNFVDTGIPMDEVVMDYITTELKGTVTAKAYGAPEGRITIKTGPVNPFSDVVETSPYYPGILWAVEKGVTNGYTDGTFGTAKPCTRAQIITFLWRAAGSPEPKAAEPAYKDVTDTTAYYYKAVQWASEQGVVGGGTFAPDAPCTRAMAVSFIWQANGGGEAEKVSFTDVADDAYYASAVNWAVAQGVTNGITATTFSPDTTCTRGQIATFLYRAAKAA